MEATTTDIVARFASEVFWSESVGRLMGLFAFMLKKKSIDFERPVLKIFITVS